jgi:hypothetical protein
MLSHIEPVWCNQIRIGNAPEEHLDAALYKAVNTTPRGKLTYLDIDLQLDTMKNEYIALGSPLANKSLKDVFEEVHGELRNASRPSYFLGRGANPDAHNLNQQWLSDGKASVWLDDLGPGGTWMVAVAENGEPIVTDYCSRSEYCSDLVVDDVMDDSVSVMSDAEVASPQPGMPKRSSETCREMQPPPPPRRTAEAASDKPRLHSLVQLLIALKCQTPTPSQEHHATLKHSQANQGGSEVMGDRFGKSGAFPDMFCFARIDFCAGDLCLGTLRLKVSIVLGRV